MIYNMDCLEGISSLSDNSIQTTITSPPYNKKGLLGKVKTGNQIWSKHNIDYDVYGDDMPESEYQEWQVKILDKIFEKTKDDGSLFYNHKMRRKSNKCYNPYDIVSKTKWNLYQLIIIDRRNSPNIRNDVLTPTTEYIFWLAKGKPKVYKSRLPKEFRSEVWVMPPKKQKDHPAPFHPLLPEICIKLSTDAGDTVLDPFMGIGTVAESCEKLGREYVGYEVSESYFKICLGKNLKCDTISHINTL